MYAFSQIFIDYAGSCQINFSIANGTLNTIISLIKDVNIVNVSTKGCGHSKDKINDKRIFINKRWLQSNGQHIGDRHLGSIIDYIQTPHTPIPYLCN